MAVSSDTSPHRSQRWDALDFWRGYLLCTIFINHVPGNAFEALTQKNYGFSDSAEGFVFLSGMSLVLAFDRRCAAGEWTSVLHGIAARCVKLYGVHVLLSLLGLAIFAAGAVVLHNDTLVQVHGRDLAVAAPLTMLLGVASLGHQFGYFNILPMYILMLVIAPALLWIGRTSPWPMMVASLTLYVLAVTRGWNLPTWPENGMWFFNPFAWQFMMASGMGVGMLARRAPIPRRLSWGVLAGLVVAFGAFSVTDGFSLMPGFRDATRPWMDIDKTCLGAGRILHFFSIAYLVYVLHIASGLRPSVLFKPIAAIGRNSLTMFAVLSLMAALGQVVMQGLGHRLLTDVVMIAVGLWVLCVLAFVLDDRRSRRRNLGSREVSARRADAAWMPGLALRTRQHDFLRLQQRARSMLHRSAGGTATDVIFDHGEVS